MNQRCCCLVRIYRCTIPLFSSLDIRSTLKNVYNLLFSNIRHHSAMAYISAAALTIIITANFCSIEIYMKAKMADWINYRIDWTFVATVLCRGVLSSTNQRRRQVITNQRAVYIVGLRSPCTRLFWGYIRRPFRIVSCLLLNDLSWWWWVRRITALEQLNKDIWISLVRWKVRSELISSDRYTYTRPHTAVVRFPSKFDRFILYTYTPDKRIHLFICWKYS